MPSVWACPGIGRKIAAAAPIRIQQRADRRTVVNRCRSTRERVAGIDVETIEKAPAKEKGSERSPLSYTTQS
jgi:hypothetical protein